MGTTTNRLTQRPKKWYKKPKVDPSNPNKQDSEGWQNKHWEFNTRNRDRPSGHVRKRYKNGYNEGFERSKFFGRLNKRFHIKEQLDGNYTQR